MEFEIDQLFVLGSLFYYIYYYISVLPAGVHVPHQRPPGQVIYGFTMANWLKGF